MIVRWDEPKRRSNLDKHGLDFAALSSEFFEQATIVQARSGRLFAIGRLADDLYVAVVFAALGTEAVSVISMRKASKKERAIAR